jgi:peptidyl-tRNA hydrolase
MATSGACTDAGKAMPPGMDPVDFVLTDFSPTETAAIEEAIARVGEAVPFMPKEGLAAAINRHN